ncbi:MAG: hypothetical protein LBV04_02515, partial [Deferribacteraceae bacterium]|nr:hypothetical protein [Deferribacteraceae bacterium]
AILYGIFDYAKVIVKIQDKKIDRAKIEALRDETIAMDCPQGSPVDGMDNPAVVLLDAARDAIYAGRYLRATKKLERIKPEDGDVYNASLIMMADLMTRKGDKAELKRIYTEASARMPQHKAYWDEKLKGL